MTLGVSTVEILGEAMRDVQWLWDKRKTKAGKEVKSLQKLLRTTVEYLKNALEGRIRHDDWLGEARGFTRSLVALTRMVDALDAGANITDFPQLCVQIDYEPKERGRQTGEQTEGRTQEGALDETVPELVEPEEDNTGPTEGYSRRFPMSPGRRIQTGDRGGASDWEAIDKLTVT